MRVIDKVLYTSRKDLLQQTKKYEQALMKKHRAMLLTPDMKQFKRWYRLVSTGLTEFLPELRKSNLVITRNSIKNAIQEDINIIQATNSVQETQKAINMTMKRIREWLGYYLPEFVQKVQDQEACIDLIIKQNRAALLKKGGTTEQDTMGAVPANKDVLVIKEVARKVKELFQLKKKQEDYLQQTMQKMCPNLTAVVGAPIGAKLVAKAGSLKRLSTLPASTVQILGAEKAFFRHLKTGAKLPKYGVLFEHDRITSSDKHNKGKVARCLADKASIAAKVDFFKGKYVGASLVKQIDKRCRELAQQGPTKKKKTVQKKGGKRGKIDTRKGKFDKRRKRKR